MTPFYKQTDTSRVSSVWPINADCRPENVFIFAVVLHVANWTLLVSSSRAWKTTLHLLSDMDDTTCAQLDRSDRDVFIRGQLSINYNSLRVTMIMKSSMMFAPGPGQHVCHPGASSLLLHQRSGCRQNICTIPTTCRYHGNKVISVVPSLLQYEFICVCGQLVCNELFIWVRPGSVHDQIDQVILCEVGVRALWIFVPAL